VCRYEEYLSCRGGLSDGDYMGLMGPCIDWMLKVHPRLPTYVGCATHTFIHVQQCRPLLHPWAWCDVGYLVS
jgi:hypothetical protein